MKLDSELESWQQEWRAQTQPLPALKRKIRRQNLRTVAAVVTICLCFAASAIAAFRYHSSLMAGGAAGISFAGLFLGAYAWWVQRGAWKPTAQTTLAYTELCYKRAVAKVRILRFAFYFLFASTVLYAGFVIWNWKHFRAFSWAMVAVLIVELFFIHYRGQRKQHDLEETKKLLDSIKE
jgi:hypothetical protein